MKPGFPTPPPELPAERSDKKSLRAFSSLKNRNYRLLWIGGVLSHTGDDMQLVAVSWLVMLLTNSPFLMESPTFFKAYPASFLDHWRCPRRPQESAQTSLDLSDHRDVFRLPLLHPGLHRQDPVLARPCPAAHFRFPEVCLFRSAGRLSVRPRGKRRPDECFGPAFDGHEPRQDHRASIAGIIIGIWGVGWCLLLNGLSFIAILISFLMMKPPPASERKSLVPNIFQSLGETYIYLKHTE